MWYHYRHFDIVDLQHQYILGYQCTLTKGILQKSLAFHIELLPVLYNILLYSHDPNPKIRFI